MVKLRKRGGQEWMEAKRSGLLKQGRPNQHVCGRLTLANRLQMLSWLLKTILTIVLLPIFICKKIPSTTLVHQLFLLIFPLYPWLCHFVHIKYIEFVIQSVDIWLSYVCQALGMQQWTNQTSILSCSFTSNWSRQNICHMISDKVGKENRECGVLGLQL